jgi:hypothetical protein
MMTEAERQESRFDVDLFAIMQDKIKTVDWEYTHGVEDMKTFGWEYLYKKGLVDKTPHYTRYEEDTIRFKKGDYLAQINMTSGTVVIQDLHSEYNYGPPTVFLTNGEINAICHTVNIIENLKDEAVHELCVNN